MNERQQRWHDELLRELCWQLLLTALRRQAVT